MKRVAVVGAGLGGMAAAIRLARAGFAVEVFEQSPQAGGKAATFSADGYRFDTGPSLLTMPFVFQRLFQEAGERLEDHLELVPLEPLCRNFFSDGTMIADWSSRGRFAEEIASSTAEPPRSLERFLDHGRRIYDAAAPLFLFQGLREALLGGKVSLRDFLALTQLDAVRSLHRANASFFKDLRLVQIFDRYATYNGSNPFRAPATLAIIPAVEYGFGGFTVRGGILEIPRAFERVARKNGVRFTLGCRVEQARRYEKLEPSTSALVFLWGMKAEFPELTVSNVFFPPDYAREFDDLFLRRRCPEDPAVFINVTSKVTPSDAPPGCENWFVMVNAPADFGQDWSREAGRARKAVLSRLERALGRDIEELIQVEEVITPPDIGARTSSTRGSLYGISSNSRRAAFLRHPNRHPRIGGLYFCGGSAHPGGGMPLVTLSGLIAADLLAARKGGPRA